MQLQERYLTLISLSLPNLLGLKCTKLMSCPSGKQTMLDYWWCTECKAKICGVMQYKMWLCTVQLYLQLNTTCTAWYVQNFINIYCFLINIIFVIILMNKHFSVHYPYIFSLKVKYFWLTSLNSDVNGHILPKMCSQRSGL